MRHNHHRIVHMQISDLMTRAAARPGKDDPMGMVGLASTLVAAQMWTKQAELDMDYRDARAVLLNVLEARIQQIGEEQ